MWYTKSYRRHLLDMHIDDWNDEFLSEFSAEEYFENLKNENIQNVMLYFQSHVGLCYYPTKSGKIHNALKGREDTMKKLVERCRNHGITVTGYYSLIYNNWAHDHHAEWKMLNIDGTSERDAKIGRYGFCCPNNKEYREFVKEQILEMAEYVEVDGMFFDMPFWPHPCYCPSCRERWKQETGGELPKREDWNDPKWRLFMQKGREWMGEFVSFAADEMKKAAPNVSVEFNSAYAGLPDGDKGLAEEVLQTSDYAGGDLYGGIYNQSFICKFYKNATNHPPFEYMFSRCTPTLATHTATKSMDEMRSAVSLTAAHHGATLVIDAIDPIGTTDDRFYKNMGTIFKDEMQYEPYFEGEMAEDVGVYYSLRSKFNLHGEKYCNHEACVNTVKTMIMNHICCGVTGSYHPLEQYPVLIASGLTEEDQKDSQRIIEYVRGGGQLYLSGADAPVLLKEFFGAEIAGRTKEKIVYIAPKDGKEEIFDYFNAKYPMHFDGAAPLAEGILKEKVIAEITLPYTDQDEIRFASIHSNPPGKATEFPAMAVTDYGKGKVVWSALPIEEVDMYDYRRIFLNVIKNQFRLRNTVIAEAPKDVEITVFHQEKACLVNLVQLNEDYKARKIEKIRVSVLCREKPLRLLCIPEKREVRFEYRNEYVTFEVENLDIFAMYQLILNEADY